MDRNDADDALRKAKLLFLTLLHLICKRLAVSELPQRLSGGSIVYIRPVRVGVRRRRVDLLRP